MGFRTNTRLTRTVLLTHLLLVVASAQDFIPPVDNWTVAQEFARYDYGSAAKYHTGVDAVRSGLTDSYGQQREVAAKAARSGSVVKIFGLNFGGTNYVRRWNPADNSYTWGDAPTPGSNRGLGTCVILYHPDIN